MQIMLHPLTDVAISNLKLSFLGDKRHEARWPKVYDRFLLPTRPPWWGCGAPLARRVGRGAGRRGRRALKKRTGQERGARSWCAFLTQEKCRILSKDRLHRVPPNTYNDERFASHQYLSFELRGPDGSRVFGPASGSSWWQIDEERVGPDRVLAS